MPKCAKSAKISPRARQVAAEAAEAPDRLAAAPRRVKGRGVTAGTHRVEGRPAEGCSVR